MKMCSTWSPIRVIFFNALQFAGLLFLVGCGQEFHPSSSVATSYEAQDFASSPSLYPGVVPDGLGPGSRGEQYDPITENPFRAVSDHPLSTFSIDVDTASYSKVRQYLVEYNRLPRPDAVRIEELLNYFEYQYDSPPQEQTAPFAMHLASSQCPWNPDHRLVRLALQGRELPVDSRPNSNLVLLIDSSGSMNQSNKLPLLKRGLRLLLRQLSESDRIAIVTYAGSAGLVLDSTPADDSDQILNALNRLEAGGSTNGGQGLELAYQVARDHLIPGGTNRVLLCTDGDFNVGMTGTDQMVQLVEQESKQGIDLSVLGFGMGNLNDAMLEQISGRGNGNYAFIDTFNEAKKVLSQQLVGTLVTIAQDVKIQIEFNPQQVSGYRLIGYENRVLANEDFNDDEKDAGDIGAGHRVTALYEVVPAGIAMADGPAQVDDLKYQADRELSDAARSDEWLTVKLRYKLPDQSESLLMEQTLFDNNTPFDQADNEFRFATAVAGFGMLLRKSEHSGSWNLDTVEKIANASIGIDQHGFRQEFVDMVSIARSLQGDLAGQESR